MDRTCGYEEGQRMHEEFGRNIAWEVTVWKREN
jgi:hypothetical protein